MAPLPRLESPCIYPDAKAKSTFFNLGPAAGAGLAASARRLGIFNAIRHSYFPANHQPTNPKTTEVGK